MVTKRQSRADVDVSPYHSVFLRELQDRISKHVTHKQSQSTITSQIDIRTSQVQSQPLVAQRPTDHDALAPEIINGTVETAYQHENLDVFDMNIFDEPFDHDLVDWSMLASTYDLPS